MATVSKKTWATIGAGVIAAIAFAMAVNTCSSERADKESVMASANAINQSNQATIDSLQTEVALTRDLLNKEKAAHMRDNDALAECGEDKEVLQDSIEVLNKRLEECEKSKQQPVAKKKPVSKKKPTTGQPCKPCKPTKPSRPSCPGNADGDVDVAGNHNRVNVNNGTYIEGETENATSVCNRSSGKTSVKVNGDSNTVNVNNGTIINNNEAEKAYVECTVRMKSTRTITYGRNR